MEDSGDSLKTSPERLENEFMEPKQIMSNKQPDNKQLSPSGTEQESISAKSPLRTADTTFGIDRLLQSRLLPGPLSALLVGAGKCLNRVDHYDH